jgi:hypothetical protein
MWYPSLAEVVFGPNMSMITASNCEIGNVIAFEKVVYCPISIVVLVKVNITFSTQAKTISYC